MVSCKVCNKPFSRSDDLNAHHREQYQPQKCGECPLLFFGAGALQKHNQAVHGFRKKHECGKCSKQFTRKCDLNRHTIKCKKSVGVEDNIHPITSQKEEVLNAKTKAEDLQFKIRTIDKSFGVATETW